MGSILLMCLLLMSIQAVTAQLPNLQSLQVPPGSRVEFEVEIEPPPQAPGSSGQQAMAGQQPAGMTQTQAMAGQQMSQTQTMAAQQPGGPMTSPIQQLLSNMAQTALQMRSIRMALPNLEEPCPCEGECCQMPLEPRRLLPVFDIPMTSHPGCCGCVDCPLSLYPMVSYMVRFAQMSSRQSSPP